MSIVDPNKEPSALGAAAIISYVLLGLVALMMIGIFCLLAWKVPIADAMIGILGALVSGVIASIGTVGGFWLASSVGARQSGATLARIASGQAPPPTTPVDDPTAPA